MPRNSPHRGLLELAEAIKDLDGFEFVLAGRVLDPEIANKLKRFSFVKFLGQLSLAESIELQKTAHVIPLLYDLQLPINRVAAPNKFYEAMMLGIPVITNLSNILSDCSFGDWLL